MEFSECELDMSIEISDIRFGRSRASSVNSASAVGLSTLHGSLLQSLTRATYKPQQIIASSNYLIN